MEMYRRTFAEINLDNLRTNIEWIQKTFPKTSFLCPMIKANAYGHGDVALGKYLEHLGIKHMGVCLIEEGLLLRRSGVEAEILVFRGFDLEGAKQLIEHNLTPVITSWEQIDYLEQLTTKPISVHLKFDTGMNRLGFRESEAEKLFEKFWQNRKLRLKALVTHLFNGEDGVSAQGKSAVQLNSFQRIFELFKPLGVLAHSLASAGMMSLYDFNEKGGKGPHPLVNENWGMRPGLLIYGYSPFTDRAYPFLKPVMTLKSHVATCRRLAPGETVSYGGRWTAQRESVIGVVPIGYADGYHRILSNKSEVIFCGKKVKQVGTICMDYLMIDITDVVGSEDLSKFKDQEVILFGGNENLNVSAEELSGMAGTITWEILTSVGERVPRVYVGKDAKLVADE